jgi:integrase
MPAKRDDTHQLIDRELVLFKRPTTAAWYCRYKIDEKWFTVTTKEVDLKKAKTAAHQILIKAKVLKEQNLPVVSKRFRDVANIVIHAMEERIAAGHTVNSYKQYKRIATDYLIPFFGKMAVANITATTMKDYDVWRAKKMGKTPMYSTVRKHNVVMNMIFKEAIVRNYMSGLKMPYLETKGEKSENYATFTVTETNIILAKMPEWVANGREHHKAQRQVLHDYTRVLIDTGARPGKELLDLQWKNIDFEIQHETTGVEYVEDKDAKERQLNYEREYIELSNGPYDEEGNPIPNTTWTPIVTLYVSGKEGSRHAVGYDVTYRVLKEITERRYKEINGNKLKALIAKQSNDRIFETSDGKRIPSALHMFQNFLEEYGLLYDKNTGKKRVFYSFRSLFSTAVMDYDDVDMRDLAKALGNSPEMLMKRYDRGTLKQIKHKLKAPNARQQLFKEVAVPAIHESAKVKAKAEKAAKATKKKASK